MATSRQTARDAAVPTSAAQSNRPGSIVGAGFSTTDIPVATPAAEPAGGNIPLCAISVLILLVVLAAIVFI